MATPVKGCASKFFSIVINYVFDNFRIEAVRYRAAVHCRLDEAFFLVRITGAFRKIDVYVYFDYTAGIGSHFLLYFDAGPVYVEAVRFGGLSHYGKHAARK